MEPELLNLPATFKLTDEQFKQLCRTNETWKIEQTATGKLIIMPPTGGESRIRNADLNFQVFFWNRQTQLGYVFDSSTIFRLPNRAKRSPDVAWIQQARWNSLSPEEKRKFPQTCPDFVIELRSETYSFSTLQSKLLDYLKNGIKLGWLIDLQTRQVEICRSDKAVEMINFSGIKTSLTLSGESVLPGFVMDLEPIFRRY
ncbi:MAG: Uma2 family endonuclease [Cyanobacteriota bacterium]|nr:Uma2 family endonuclease [Cyanobacteriota bacterium]